jgi:hypothetical protein
MLYPITVISYDITIMFCDIDVKFNDSSNFFLNTFMVCPFSSTPLVFINFFKGIQ